MRIITDPDELVQAGAFVPTMGALHEGHLALMRRARDLGGPVVISIFVNPTQFGPGEDWERYPRTLDADVEAARSAGVDVVFAPALEMIYPEGPAAGPDVPLPDVATRPGLEDAHRPGHFAGVCQVVARLFDLVRPAFAVFGEKDYQQLQVIRAMVNESRGRWGGLEIVAHPTVRDADGLALSSRNAYLEPGDRDRALGLFRALMDAGSARRHGATPAEAEEAMQRRLDCCNLAVDYAAVRDAATLETPAGWANPTRALIAARLGDVRLIDNASIE